MDRVAPFGGSFSALWFQPVSAFLIRTFHILLWVQHALWGYVDVDDIFMVQASAVIESCASLLLAFFATFGLPISWPKPQLGPSLRWIGWRITLRAQVFSVPPEKLTKLVTACITVLENPTTTVKALQSLLGLLHWLLHVAPILKPWLSCLYK